MHMLWSSTPTEMCTCVQNKNVLECLCQHNSHLLETNQMPSGSGIEELIIAYSYNVILESNKNELQPQSAL